MSDPNYSEDYYIWSDDESSDNDPVRVGGSIDINPFPSDGGLSTDTVKSRGTRALIEDFVEIDKMANRLGLPNTVKDQAKEIYIRLLEISVRKKIQESVPCSLKEMTKTASGMKIKNVSKAKKHIKKRSRKHRRTMMEPTGSNHKVDKFEERRCDFVNFDF